MRAPRQLSSCWMAAAAWCAVCQAQPLSAPPDRDVVLSARFLTTISYEAALTRLGSYYQEQVGRILPLSFPQIAPRQHYEVWHDIWVSFDPAPGGMAVTLKRPTGGLAVHLVKPWMLDVAGRLEGAMPLEFKEEPALRRVESDIYASHRDLARALQSEASFKPLPTWQHAGLMVSAAPLAWVVLAPVGPHGVHHVAVSAETAAAARQLLAKLIQGVQKPGIYAAYSEEAELAQEIHDAADGKSAAGVASPPALSGSAMDEKYLESKLRADPEMMKRSAAAQGQYDIRLRLDKVYHRVTVSWSELTGYARLTGRFEAERAMGHSELAAPKPPAASGNPLTARTRLSALPAGAYRIRVEGEDAAGQTTAIDQRTYWFDGKSFEEL